MILQAQILSKQTNKQKVFLTKTYGYVQKYFQNETGKPLERRFNMSSLFSTCRFYKACMLSFGTAWPKQFPSLFILEEIFWSIALAVKISHLHCRQLCTMVLKQHNFVCWYWSCQISKGFFFNSCMTYLCFKLQDTSHFLKQKGKNI